MDLSVKLDGGCQTGIERGEDGESELGCSEPRAKTARGLAQEAREGIRDERREARRKEQEGAGRRTAGEQP